MFGQGVSYDPLRLYKKLDGRAPMGHSHPMAFQENLLKWAFNSWCGRMATQTSRRSAFLKKMEKDPINALLELLASVLPGKDGGAPVNSLSDVFNLYEGELMRVIMGHRKGDASSV